MVNNFVIDQDRSRGGPQLIMRSQLVGVINCLVSSARVPRHEAGVSMDVRCENVPLLRTLIVLSKNQQSDLVLRRWKIMEKEISDAYLWLVAGMQKATINQ